jgi:hypothetical protein
MIKIKYQVSVKTTLEMLNYVFNFDQIERKIG